MGVFGLQTGRCHTVEFLQTVLYLSHWRISDWSHCRRNFGPVILAKKDEEWGYDCFRGNLTARPLILLLLSLSSHIFPLLYSNSKCTQKKLPDLPNACTVLPNPALPNFLCILYCRQKHTILKTEQNHKKRYLWVRGGFFHAHCPILYILKFFRHCDGFNFAIMTDLVFFASMSIRHCDAS